MKHEDGAIFIQKWKLLLWPKHQKFECMRLLAVLLSIKLIYSVSVKGNLHFWPHVGLVDLTP